MHVDEQRAIGERTHDERARDHSAAEGGVGDRGRCDPCG
jgi:hypothetical protein